MKSFARSTFLKIALVPLTAALTGTVLVLLLYVFQPSLTSKPSQTQGIYQDHIGIVQTDSQVFTNPANIQIL